MSENIEIDINIFASIKKVPLDFINKYVKDETQQQFNQQKSVPLQPSYTFGFGGKFAPMTKPAIPSYPTATSSYPTTQMNPVSPYNLPPCFACIFSSQRNNNGHNEYSEMAIKMDELAKLQPGYLGIESSRDSTGFGITVSYWDSLKAIKYWKDNADHISAQQHSIIDWYKLEFVK